VALFFEFLNVRYCILSMIQIRKMLNATTGEGSLMPAVYKMQDTNDSHMNFAGVSAVPWGGTPT
jgi:hypothetical protein